MSSAMPEILEELADTIAAALIKRGVSPAVAREAATEGAELLRQHFGGATVYIPRGRARDLERRNVEIRRRLAAGENRALIRREFNLSDIQVGRIEAAGEPGDH